MIAGKRVLALIPARSGSKGLPDKNIRLLAGKPLLCWPVEAALQSTYIDRVVVSTDSEEYAQIAKLSGAEVPFIRPPELSSDSASSISFILHALDCLSDEGESFDYLVLLEPTSPLTESGDIDSALERLDSGRDTGDAIVSVAELVSGHPTFAMHMAENGLLTPYLSETEKVSVRRQDLSSLYQLDGSFYISSVDALRMNQGFYHKRTMAKIMPYYKSFEVDDLVDFICIEALQKNRALLSE